MSMQTGITDCQAVTESTVKNCNEDDFENHSYKSPSLCRHASKGALADLCLIRYYTGTVDRGGSRKGVPRSISSVGFKRVTSTKPQPSGGISDAVFMKGHGEGRKSGIDQNVFILLLAKEKTNVAED